MITCTAVDETPESAFGCICHSPAFARLNAIVEQKFSRRSFLTGAAAAAGIPAAPAKPV
ncbi:Tat (Twin-arginine translocation) pathway signal sequence OS=Bosea thiooxidans OX=53254 GN=SAMN05660750_01888 PE=4 SV=1 [Bosea thiooxidans]|jgi:hypothetical protein|uniref:Tat (Twin-arginine translocation) pathway signal sequence n=1 Tax=Bosea thiooxidans TaxID=53254 RepID=A0A1T5DB01_9HYPH|nr:Tat (twin-arginine translocation) pathway signal sequence [Bosea thiooxidans]